MPKALNVLFVEDSPADARLLLNELHQAGFELTWKRIETEAEFLVEIQKLPDLILSDYSLPTFDGLRAAEILQNSGLDIPFILVSGTVGESAAVEAMKRGATDYLLKDRITRLGKAVEQAMEQKNLRRKQRQADSSLSLFRNLVDRSSDGLEAIDPESGRFLAVNQTTCDQLGYTREELLSMSVPEIELTMPDAQSWASFTEETRRSGFKVIEGRHKCKDGSSFPVEVHVRCVQLDREYLIASVREITARKQAEAEIQNQLSELKRWHELTLGREERILEIKQEVNELLTQLQLPARYAQPSTE